ncbi:MAG: hypothetical protein ACI9OU_002221 [Candidatus Promineifilaceae bacterium]|jgi:hypothetical protein
MVEEELIDRISVAQPAVLFTMLALSQDGVPMPMLDHGLHILMVVHIALPSTKNRCKQTVYSGSFFAPILLCGHFCGG